MGNFTGAGGLALDDLQTLCVLGFAGERTDGQLIALFLGRDQTTSEQAFRVLVERHGPMVFGVCRRVLADRHAAEDALQATFLVLAKRARSIRRHESVGGWLHRVARRLAVRAGKAARRQKIRQEVVAQARAIQDVHDLGLSLERSELRVVLDQEIDRIDSACRHVMILCDLEGLTYDQAADRLRWPVGTVKSRLSRARSQLRERLVRRGFGPAILVGAGVLRSGEASAALTSPLVQTVVKTALGGLAGTNVVPAVVASLAKDELSVGLTGKLKVLVSTLVLFGSSVAVLAFSSDTNPPRTPRQLAVLQGPDEIKSKAAGKEASNASQKVSASGKVVDAEGRPVAGARVFLRDWATSRTIGLKSEHVKDLKRKGQLPDILAETQTDADGLFRLKDIDAPAFPDRNVNRNLGISWFPWDLVVLAEGHGLAWVRLTPQNQREALTVRLSREASLRGRVTTVDGQPVPGVKVRAMDVAEFLAANEARSTVDHLNLQWSSVPLSTTTDEEGRFVLHGLVPERRISLAFQAEGFQQVSLLAATSAKRPPDFEGRPIFVGDLSATLKRTSHQLSGRLVFESTGGPVVGAFVSVKHDPVGQTDQDGRFTVKDLAAGTIELHAKPQGTNSVPLDVAVEIPEGEDVVEETFRLPLGITVSGRVVDVHGAGVEGVELRYEHAPEGKGIRSIFLLRAKSDDEGKFQLNVPAGPGIIILSELPQGYQGTEGRQGDLVSIVGASRRVEGASGGMIDNLKFTLRRSRHVMVQALDTTGQPVEGVEVRHYGVAARRAKPLFTNAEGRADVVGLDFERVNVIDLIHSSKRLGARVEVSKNEAQDAEKDMQVKLMPLGSVEGRVLDPDGKPLVGPILWLGTDAKTVDPTGSLVESKNEVKSDGTFRFDSLIPGATYFVDVEVAGYGARNGQTFVAKPGDLEHLEPLRLSVTQRSLKGIVVDPGGQPVKNAIVAYRHRARKGVLASGRWYMPTDAMGRFELTNLPQGELSIMSFQPATGSDRIGRLLRAKIDANQADARLVLPD